MYVLTWISSIDHTLLAALLAAVISMISLIATLTISIINYHHGRKLAYSHRVKEITDIYNHLAEFRFNHPEVMWLAREWESQFLTLIYSRQSTDFPEHLVYYCYTEQCINYCNLVLQAKSEGFLRGTAYYAHHEPLVKLVLTENYPIIKDFIREGKYMSSLIGRFIDRLEQKGWNWEKEYKMVCCL